MKKFNVKKIRKGIIIPVVLLGLASTPIKPSSERLDGIPTLEEVLDSAKTHKLSDFLIGSSYPDSLRNTFINEIKERLPDIPLNSSYNKWANNNKINYKEEQAQTIYRCLVVTKEFMKRRNIGNYAGFGLFGDVVDSLGLKYAAEDMLKARRNSNQTDLTIFGESSYIFEFPNGNTYKMTLDDYLSFLKAEK